MREGGRTRKEKKRGRRKGEGRHKRIQVVSPLFFWKREKRDTKRIQAVSPWRILFGKGRRDEKNE